MCVGANSVLHAVAVVNRPEACNGLLRVRQCHVPLRVAARRALGGFDVLDGRPVPEQIQLILNLGESGT